MWQTKNYDGMFKAILKALTVHEILKNRILGQNLLQNENVFSSFYGGSKVTKKIQNLQAEKSALL